MNTAALCVLSACALPGHTATADQMFDSANKAYVEGHYPEAITSYRRVLDSNHYSAALLFNLGNAYAKTGQVGPAVLNYQRALFLAPTDRAAAANLAIEHKLKPSTRYENLARTLSMTDWSLIGCAGWSAIAVAAFLARLLQRRKSWILLLGFSGGLAVLMAFAGIAVWWPTLNEAVVMQTTSARMSPFEAAQPQFSLDPGDVVTVKKVHAGFSLVTTPNGQSAWIESSAIEPVVKRS